jgi:pimeloyl-ACP methyl ester carboxylesterase
VIRWRGPRPRFRVSPAGAQVVLAVLVIGVFGSVTPLAGPASASAAPAEIAARSAPRIDWRPCGVRLQCARVRVPLNWSLRSGRRITLPVIRHLASRPGRRLGSLFVNPGGAGGSTEFVRANGGQLDALGRGRFDVIGWELRGTGGSPAVDCFADQRSRARFWGDLAVPTTPIQARSFVPKVRGFADRCAARNRTLLAHNSTADDARDLDYLRLLVGDRKLTYRAVSYGTFLGQTYANMFPRRVRAMALDGIIDPRIVMQGSEARFANNIAGADRGLRLFTSLCQEARAARCALAGQGSVADRVERLLTGLPDRPVPAPTARPAGALTYSDALTSMAVRLTTPSAWPELAADLDAASNGDGSALATHARTALAATRTAQGEASDAISCSDSPARRRLGAWPDVSAMLTGVSRISGPLATWGSWAPCAAWLVRAVDRYTGPWNATTRHPILLVGTRYDPGTPYANARRVAALLGNAVLLTHDGYGHTSEADPSRCVERATSAYLTNLQTPRRGTTCRSDRRPFDPRFGEPLP